MLSDIKNDAKTRMDKTLDSLRAELAKIRTGRAHPSLLEHINVEYYGAEVPISQAANVSVEDSRTLAVTAWDKSMVGKIEKAIMTSDLGLNPATAGTVIRVPLPALTEERRGELSRIVHGEGEQAKVAVRNIRRDANHHIKDLVKDKQITEDDQRRAESEIQQLTDQHVERIDAMVAEKEKELMEI
jgi:ribosome recycling factor